MDTALPPTSAQAAVLAVARSFGVPFGVERSIKLSRHGVDAARMLASLPAAVLGANPAPGFGAMCDKLGVPEGARAKLRPHLGAATHLHLGAEGDDPTSAACKVYLEFAAPPVGDRTLVFIASKWRVAGPSGFRTTRYRRLDTASLDEWLATLDDPFGRVLRALGAAALARGAAPRALAVTDDGGPRRSVDLNLYDAGLTVAEVAGPVTTLSAAFGQRADVFLDRSGATLLGHVAAGDAAHGEPFATIYFGAVEATP